jgi:hypothetical protein
MLEIHSDDLSDTDLKRLAGLIERARREEEKEDDTDNG